MSADRYNFNKSFSHIKKKYIGTGDSDISKFDWAVEQHRDTISTYLGHSDMLLYFSSAQNESIGRTKYDLLEVIEKEKESRGFFFTIFNYIFNE